MSDGLGPVLRESPNSAKRAEFLDLERHCSGRPDDFESRRRLLQLFIALAHPDDLPGSSLVLAPGTQTPRIAVLTPYFQEPLELIARCHRSVVRQSLRCEHVLIADGFPRRELDKWPISHLRLATPSNNFGDTPRRIAGEFVIESGFDGVVYCDADNWLRPRHVESLFACHLARNTPLCHSARTRHRIDETLFPLLQRGDNCEHVDGNCLFVAAAAFDLLPLWGTWPRALSCIDDRMIWHSAMSRGYAHSFTGAMTICYQSGHIGTYRAVGETPPPDARPDVDLDQLFSWHAALPLTERDELDRRWGFSVTSLLAGLRSLKG